MKETIFSVAQIETARESIPENIEKHVFIINEASRHGAQFILFPEMSLTGYEREIAGRLHFTSDDVRFEDIQTASSAKDIIVTVGAPLMIDEKLYISSIIFHPDKEKEIYLKKFLHPGEETVFHTRPGFTPYTFINNEKIAQAICYDIEKDEHINEVKNNGATIYAASIFYSAKGIDSGIQRLQDIAVKHDINILMSNYTGKCWGIDSGGRSAICSRNGDIIIESRNTTESILIAGKSNDIWTGKEITI